MSSEFDINLVYESSKNFWCPGFGLEKLCLVSMNLATLLLAKELGGRVGLSFYPLASARLYQQLHWRQICPTCCSIWRLDLRCMDKQNCE